MNRTEHVLQIPGLISFWDFQETAGQPRVAKGPHTYALTEREGPIQHVSDGIFGPRAAELRFGQWFHIPRAEAPALNIHGTKAKLTIAAWLKRYPLRKEECQAIAGMWNETEKQRQYCLFLDLGIWDSAHQVCGHVSATGGPSKGHKWCMDAAIGATPLPYDTWQLAVFTFDTEAKVYLNGKLDQREGLNPFPYPEGLYDGGEAGADFTVAAVHRGGEIGNFFEGLFGGLAVFDRALEAHEVADLYDSTTT